MKEIGEVIMNPGFAFLFGVTFGIIGTAFMYQITQCENCCRRQRDPAKLAEVEVERQAVCDKYVTVQVEIDAAGDVDALKMIGGSSG